ncbi:MAG: flavin reductase family protein [Lachnospiraceae bacterium]|nr:flavin reductase family protein [Lachnospiraceae bacterium]
MEKTDFKPGNMLYPLPAVMVSCGYGKFTPNILTVAWTGTVCTNPPMVYISVRPSRHSYDIIAETREFVINLTTEELARAMDKCGVRSGRDLDKWADLKLTKAPSKEVNCPSIEESPVNIECKVTDIIKLGSHDMFLAEVVNVRVDKSLLDDRNSLRLEKAGLIAYSHGKYHALGKILGSFGYSVRKKPMGKTSKKKMKNPKKHSKNA